MSPGVLTNGASVDSGTYDPNIPVNNSVTQDTAVCSIADLAIEKAGSVDVIAGEENALSYTITVTNNGPSDARLSRFKAQSFQLMAVQIGIHGPALITLELLLTATHLLKFV